MSTNLTLVILTLLISNNHLSRSENLVRVLTWKSSKRYQVTKKKSEKEEKEQFLLFSTIVSKYL